jgi:hypothetical protein
VPDDAPQPPAEVPDDAPEGALTVDDVLHHASLLPGVVVETVAEGSDAPAAAWGDSFITYDPDGTADRSRWQPFATVVTSDHPGFDESSRLDRPGVFRVNVGVGRELFAELLGYPPAEAAEHTGEVDPSTSDVWLPHPAYAVQGWVCVVRPGRRTGDRLRRLLEQTHARAAARYRRG